MTQSLPWNCPECGAENPPDHKECSACGLIVPRAQRIPAASEPAPADEPTGESAPVPGAPVTPRAAREPAGGAAEARPKRRRSESEEGTRRSRGRARAEPSKHNKRNFALLGVAVVVLGVGGWWLLRTPSFEERLEDLVATWNAGGEDRFGSFDEGQNWGKFEWEMSRRGWNAEPPRMTVVKTEVKPVEGVDATFVLGQLEGSGSILVLWREKRSYGWVPIDWTFPDVAGEPGDAATARLKEAWSAEGAEAFVALLTPEYRDRMAGKVVQSLERRDWVLERPAITSVGYERERTFRAPFVAVSMSGDFESRVTMGRSRMRLWWQYRYPEWQISKIAFGSR